MAHGQKEQQGGDILSTILFLISVPLAFGLGMWCSYLLLQNPGSDETQALRQKNERVEELRRARTRLEERLREATQELKTLRSRLSEAKEKTDELKNQQKQAAQNRDNLKARLRTMRQELEELRQANNTLQQRLAETTESTRGGTPSTDSVSAGQENVPGLQILAADAEVTDRNQTFWQYSWRVRLGNRSDRKLQLMGQVLFQDKEGSRVSGSPLDCQLKPGETKSLSGDCLIRSASAGQVEQLSVTVSEIPEDQTQ